MTCRGRIPAHAAWYAIVVVVSGCSGGIPEAPTVPGDASAFEDPEVEPPPGLEQDPPRSFRLLAGDQVRLMVMSADTKEYEGLRIDERGTLHVPLAGDVEVGGLTLSKAEARVEKALQEYDRVAQAAIIVTEPEGHRATVIGAVENPGRVTVPAGTRLADLVALAGGPMRTVRQGDVARLADLHGARLVRDDRTLPVSLPLALEGETKHNVRIRAGDHLYVPPRTLERIVVLGKVAEPTSVHYKKGMLLTDALARAGGVHIDGDNGDIRIIRGSFRDPKLYTTSLTDMWHGAANVQLAPGDIVYVTEHWIASLGEVLDRLGPLLSSATGFATTWAVFGLTDGAAR